jgi:flap endonuclease-1
MGVKIYELFPATDIELASLSGKRLAVDASIFLYQFLATIRSRDGSLLTDSHGNVTSHLVGLLSRTANMMQQGIMPCFVFDGKPPELKMRTLRQRAERKIEAAKQLAEATAVEDLEAMKKLAARTSRLTPEMVQEAKHVIDALGLPVIQAPSEGEAQAALLAKKGDVWAVASQDADSLLFGAPRLVRNLAVTGRRKKVGILAYEEVKPQLIELAAGLKHVGITHDQLLVLSLLVGTDYNPGGIKGIGPHKALKLVQEHGNDFDALFKAVDWDEHADIGWQELIKVFKNMPVTEDYTLKFRQPDIERLRAILVDGHDFQPERIDRVAAMLGKQHTGRQQKGLGSFL